MQIPGFAGWMDESVISSNVATKVGNWISAWSACFLVMDFSLL